MQQLKAAHASGSFAVRTSSVARSWSSTGAKNLLSQTCSCQNPETKRQTDHKASLASPPPVVQNPDSQARDARTDASRHASAPWRRVCSYARQEGYVSSSLKHALKVRGAAGELAWRAIQND
eukprot:7088294-Pyramimonas_sp.AAC.1